MPVLQLQHVCYFIQHTLDLLFPPTCVLCKKPGSILCPGCQQNLHLQESSIRCTHCHGTVEQNGQCLACRSHQLKINGLRTYGRHQGTLRTCIHALKYGGQTQLAKPLGALLAQTYHMYGMQADFLVPLPLHTIRQKQRGYNHAALLARACAEELRIPVCEDLVMRHRATAAQVGLSSQQRHQNVAGAFSCISTITTGALFKRSIIIIDDVCTTGATLEACAETLFSAGAQSVWGLVLARSG
jgi:ComF family protein